MQMGVGMKRRSGFRYAVLAAVVIAATLFISPHNASAVDYIVNYDKRLPNGKICRVILGETHWHVGNAADRSKSRSQRKAIKDWSGFVVFEYGRRYGRWSVANKRSMRCEHDGDKNVWRCRAEAQPCRR